MKVEGVTRRMTAWFVLAGLTVAPTIAGAQDEVIGIAVGSTPPAAAVQDLAGNPVELSRWVGKQPVLVEFWATWCPSCEALLPRMEAAHRKYGDRVAFLVIAVAVNQRPATVRRHLQRHPMPFTFLWDASGAAVRAFEAPATSYVAVLDGQGKVVYTGIGADQDINAAAEKALDGAIRRGR